MNQPVKLDWTFAAGLSVPVAVGILLWKLDRDQAAAISQKAIDAIKEYAIAVKGNS